MSNYNNKTYEPVKISLTMHGVTHTVEGLDWDSDGEELIHQFKCLLVGAGFHHSIAREEDE